MDLVYKAEMLSQGGRSGTIQSDDGSVKIKLAVPASVAAYSAWPTVFAGVVEQMDPAGAPPLTRIPGGQWTDSMTERVVWARKRMHEALDAVGGISSPGGCAVWHVAGLGRSVKEWSAVEGWNGRTLNQYEAKGILVGALAVLAVHYGYSR